MRRPAALLGALLTSTLAVTAGCSAGRATDAFRDGAVPTGSFQLVAFDSCADMLGKLRDAARRYVGPYGFGGGYWSTPENGLAARDSVAGGAPAPGAPAPAVPGAAEKGGSPEYSSTNTHEKGVDEPDLVKTDGRRIVTVTRGVLRVVDPVSKRVTGTLDLRRSGQDPIAYAQLDLLLAGDRALILSGGTYDHRGGLILEDGPGKPAGPGTTDPQQIAGPKLLLVDLAETAPRLASTYTVDGRLLDARQVGSTVRVVVVSGPRLNFPYHEKQTNAQRIAANQAIVDRAGADDWLPRYEVTNGTRTTRGRVDCAAVSRPAIYSGTSMTTVLSFELGRSTLSNGNPVTIVADGQAVYSNGASLYVANDQRWQVVPEGQPRRPGEAVAPVEPRTELYKFDTSGTGRPAYLAAGAVPGWLLNQYSMSEWDGHLRVATTSGQERGRNARSSSAVYVLRQQGKRLVETGKATGLGKGERIYSVRYAGTVGYVVTFRQTDPLYTVDLSDPRAPKVLGELKITGYSSYLHPDGDERLIGIGQEATEQGRVQGTQVSVFDVSDLANPRRVAQHHVRFGHSEAEFDPHAFLYWPKTGMLVVPLISGRTTYSAGALVLTVGDGGIDEVGTVEHPWDEQTGPYSGQIRRSLVIDDVLWTVSDVGLLASDPDTLDKLAWIEF